MILAILQAPTGKSGLPGAAMMPILRTPMIVRQIERLSRSRRIDRLVVIASDQAGDDALVAVVRREAIAVHRGPPDAERAALIAVLDAHGGDHVVKMAANCPLTEPEAIDDVIDRHLSRGADHTSNTPPGSASPEGQAIDVLSAVALRQWKPDWLPAPAGAATVRWSVERPDDYAFVATVYDHLYPRNRAFTSDDVRAFVRSREDLLTYGGEPRA